MKQKTNLHWGKSLISFLVVLLTMPLGHALMITMEHIMSETALHFAAFAMGAIGLIMVIIGVFAKHDTQQTLWGLFGGLLFWTGWVEFLLMYYANRFGALPQITNGTISTVTEYVNGIAVHSQMLLNGEPVKNIQDIKSMILTRPEYLIMPSSFGFWAMFMMIYLFSIRSGCNFFNWCQKTIFGHRRNIIVARPMTRHTSIVTFMQLNMMMWSCYLLLMFCYDENFLGVHHPITIFTGVGCLVGSLFIFWRQLKLSAWGSNIRMAIATVIVFWTPVEILGRMNFFNEIWVAPMHHKTEIISILAAFVLLAAYVAFQSVRNNKNRNKDMADTLEQK